MNSKEYNIWFIYAEQDPGPQKKQQLTGLVSHALSARNVFAGQMVQASLTPVDLWSNPVAVADLLQLWADAQGAAGGGARSAWTETGRALNKLLRICHSLNIDY